jgi:hypothetical protein
LYDVGLNETVIGWAVDGFRETVVEAVTVAVPTTAVAVTVTTGFVLCRIPRPDCATIVEGATYRPDNVIEPKFDGLIDQVAGLAVPFIVAVNCWL